VHSWLPVTRGAADHLQLAQQRGRSANITRWMTKRDAIYDQIMDRGWNPKVARLPARALTRAAVQLP
jgi:GH15 family glucan-1,4-alpha-glucosidase